MNESIHLITKVAKTCFITDEVACDSCYLILEIIKKSVDLKCAYWYNNINSTTHWKQDYNH